MKKQIIFGIVFGIIFFGVGFANFALAGPEDPIPGIPVGLEGDPGSIKASATTDANGNYNFTNLPAGKYKLSIPDQPTKFVIVGADGKLSGIAMEGEPIPGVDYRLGIANVGTLPTSPFYFFKELGRGFSRFFTFNATAKAELELKITNEKAAEALAVEKANPDDAEVLTKALQNYTKAQERLNTRLLKLKDNSENPKVAELLKKVDEKTAKHAELLEQLAGKIATGTIVNDDTGVSKILDNARNNIEKTFTASVEKENDIKQSATDQSKRAEDTILEANNALQEVSTTRGMWRPLTGDTGQAGISDQAAAGGLISHLAGLQPSDLIILAARPSLGKTALALAIAKNAALHHNSSVGIFSLEMSKDQVVDRLISAESSVNLWCLRTGKLEMGGEYNDFARIRDSLDKLSKAKIFIDDAASPDVLQMKTMARRLQAEHGLDLIIVDYLQLIKPRGTSDNPVQQITEISRSLKALAKELNVPVIALSQLSRAVEQRPSKIPRLSDLRDSGSIEQDADLVLFISREEERDNPTKKSNEAQIIIAKHRNGPVGFVNLYFDEQRATFTDIANEYSGPGVNESSGIQVEF